jgi:Co/Zn/Cd efflux system component
MVGAVVGALVYSAVVIGLDGWEKFDPTISILLGVLVGGTVGYQLGKGVP